MTRILKRVEAHYGTHEVPFGQVYEWQEAYVTVRCDCGAEAILTSTSPSTTCRCGANLSAFVGALEEPQGRLPDTVTHPWFYDGRARVQQSRRDQAAYPKGSPWRYNDITENET